MPEMAEVTITLHRRPDGGLRVHSESLPGLILSGPDQDGVVADIGPAIRALLEHRGEWPRVPSEEEDDAYLAAIVAEEEAAADPRVEVTPAMITVGGRLLEDLCDCHPEQAVTVCEEVYREMARAGSARR